MEIGIVGLPQSGKKTLFHILTNLDPEKNKIGISRVNDPRVDFLAGIYKPDKIVLPEIEYVLAPDIVKTVKEKDAALNSLLNLDSFIFLARAFKDDSVYHIEGSIDAARDIRDFISDLIVKDLFLIEKRIEALALDIRKKPSDEKKKELKLVSKIKEHLDKESFLKTMDFSMDEKAMLSAYQFLTDKTLMVAVNFSEGEDIPEGIDGIRSAVSNPNTVFTGLSAKVEHEIAGLDDEKMKKEFMDEMGITEPARDKFIRFSYDSLDLISFFTVVSGEVRVWSIRKGSSILAAARKIHQDMEKGFIRAEVIKHEDLKKHSSIQKIKEAGLLYLKGKDYLVEDGDIITFRFNV